MLQAIDEDKNPDNGIKVTTAIEGFAEPINFNVPFQQFIDLGGPVDNLAFNYLGGVMPSYDDVVDHLSRQLGLRGTWTADGGKTHVMFLAGSRFLWVNDAGFEFGNYAHDSANQRFTLQLTLDQNGSAGFNNGSELQVLNVDASTLKLSLNDSESRYTRQANTSTSIIDTWVMQSDSSNDLLVLSLLESGRFVAVKAAGTDPLGLEVGRYTLDQGTLELVADRDDNGDAGFFAGGTTQTTVSATYTADNLTLNNADIDFVFERD